MVNKQISNILFKNSIVDSNKLQRNNESDVELVAELSKESKDNLRIKDYVENYFEEDGNCCSPSQLYIGNIEFKTKMSKRNRSAVNRNREIERIYLTYEY
jgi:hypothetical protein